MNKDKFNVLKIFRVRFLVPTENNARTYIDVAETGPTEALMLGLLALPEGTEFISIEVTGTTMVVAA